MGNHPPFFRRHTIQLVLAIIAELLLIILLLPELQQPGLLAILAIPFLFGYAYSTTTTEKKLNELTRLIYGWGLFVGLVGFAIVFATKGTETLANPVWLLSTLRIAQVYYGLIAIPFSAGYWVHRLTP